MRASKKTHPLSKWSAPSREGKHCVGLLLHNSLTGDEQLREFIPIKGREVTWYGCGPTVYDAAHMGHARTYVNVDILQRVMENYFGYKLRVCMNITNVDDKIINGANEAQVSFCEFARQWEWEFFKDMKALNVRLPDIVTRVSEFIPEIVAMIQQIIANGFTYETDGNVYFDVQAMKASEKHEYARMEPWSAVEGGLEGWSWRGRGGEGEGGLGRLREKGTKRSTLDFALRKKAVEGEPFWESLWAWVAH